MTTSQRSAAKANNRRGVVVGTHDAEIDPVVNNGRGAIVRLRVDVDFGHRASAEQFLADMQALEAAGRQCILEYEVLAAQGEPGPTREGWENIARRHAALERVAGTGS